MIMEWTGGASGHCWPRLYWGNEAVEAHSEAWLATIDNRMSHTPSAAVLALINYA